MNQRSGVLFGIVVLAVLIYFVGFWPTPTNETQNTSVLQEVEVTTSRDGASLETDYEVKGGIGTISGMGPAVSGAVSAKVLDIKGAELLETVFEYAQFTLGKPHASAILSNRDELEMVRAALETKGWVFKEEESPWPTVFLLEAWHSEKGYIISVGCVKK